MVAGIRIALGEEVKVIAVEPDLAPTLNRALANGSPLEVPVAGVASDSLGASVLGDIAFQVCSLGAVESVCVRESSIIEARKFLWSEYRLACEYGGATALSAILSGCYKPEPGERVVVVICGAYTDPSDLLDA